MRTFQIIKNELTLLKKDLYLSWSNCLFLLLFIVLVRPLVRLFLLLKILIFFIGLMRFPLILYKGELRLNKILDVAFLRALLAFKNKNRWETFVKLTLNYFIIFFLGTSIKVLKISFRLYNSLEFWWYFSNPILNRLKGDFYEEFFLDYQQAFKLKGSKIKLFGYFLRIK